MLSTVLGLVLVVVLSASLYTFYRGGFPDRFENVSGSLNFERDNQKLKFTSRTLSTDRKKENPYFEESKIGVLIVGNSHGKDMFNVFYQNRGLYPEFDFLRGDVAQLSCFDTKNEGNRPYADEFFSSKNYQDSRIVAISTRYKTDYCDNKNKQIGEASDFDGLSHLIERAQADGKAVVVFGNNVMFRGKNKKLLSDYEFEQMGNNATKTLKSKAAVENFINHVNRKYYENRQVDAVDEINDRVNSIAESHAATYVDKEKLACIDKERICFGMTPDGHKGFYDSSHYTLEGAKFFGQRMSDAGMRELLLGLVNEQSEGR